MAIMWSWARVSQGLRWEVGTQLSSPGQSCQDWFKGVLQTTDLSSALRVTCSLAFSKLAELSHHPCSSLFLLSHPH